MIQDNRFLGVEATKESPCPHCGKPDWCYKIGKLTVCKRPHEPAVGWEATSKTDKDGDRYYAPVQPKKAVRPKATKEFFYHDRQGNPLIKVSRIDDGKGGRKFYQSHWDDDRQRWVRGVPDDSRLQVPLYRYQQVQKAIAAGRTIYFVEGEGVADLLCTLGLQATTSIGGSDRYRRWGSYKQDLAGADIVICPDRDVPGMKYAQEIEKDFPNARWLYAPPSEFLWQNLPKAKGLDIVDWINEGATVEDIKAAIGAKKYGELPKVEAAQGKIEQLDFSLPEVEEIFTQKAQDALFGDTRWISLNGHLYRWMGTHYQLIADPTIKANIARWCASTPVWNKAKEGYSYSYARSSVIENIWNWVVFAFAVDPALVNPPGINCLNGTVKLHWEGKKVSWQLHPHDENDFYIYANQIVYDPEADPTQCDHLLACLDVEQQDIYLKTVAASLDLATVRKYRSRIKAVFCQGLGNNGKDSLREATGCVFGSAMTSATISDFQIYDTGKKFPLAKLENSLVNWSSENSSVQNIDKLQSLKAAITGEPLDVERKNQDERPMLLNTIFFFNINEPPNLQAGLEAIQSRWAVLSFNKTYKVGADLTKGELEADARFRYDPEFLQTEVVPALLNKILDALPRLIDEGIDYSCTQKALEQIQQETNHLWAFSQQVGLDYQVGGRVYINELWEKLKDWYIANGTLEVQRSNDGKEKLEWHEQVNGRDKNIKGANQIYQRFSKLFPKISRVRDSQSLERKGQWFLSGIAFSEASEAVSEAVGEAVSRPQSGSEASEAVEATLLQLLNQLQMLEPLELRKILLKIANSSNVEQTASLASLVDTARAVASPTASPTASPASLENNQVMYANQSNPQKSTPIQAATVKGNTIQSGDTANNFFPTAYSCFKEGDRCKVKRPFWGIPNGRVCTIHKINNGVATVFYKGCQSPSGVDVPLAELELVK